MVNVFLPGISDLKIEEKYSVLSLDIYPVLILPAQHTHPSYEHINDMLLYITKTCLCL